MPLTPVHFLSFGTPKERKRNQKKEKLYPRGSTQSGASPPNPHNKEYKIKKPFSESSVIFRLAIKCQPACLSLPKQASLRALNRFNLKSLASQKYRSCSDGQAFFCFVFFAVKKMKTGKGW
jgi:hypothetical protein